MKAERTSKAAGKRPGRPPLGRKPFTVAELKRRYRAKKRTAGMKEFSVMLEPQFVEVIEQLAASSGLSRRQLVQTLLDEALGRLMITKLTGELEQLRGSSPQVIQEAIHRASTRPYEGIDDHGGNQLASK